MNSTHEDFEPVWAAGFMSGTSLDAVDAALILTDGARVLDFGAVAERKYTAEERAVLQAGTQAARDWNWRGAEPAKAFAEMEAVINATHLDAWRMMLEDWDGPKPILAGVHGQTVLHRRPTSEAKGATRQLLDGVALQAGLGLPLAFDFRTADVAAGGQGAPLAPIYHGALLERMQGEAAAVLNLGGVANITGRAADGTLSAFDTGPANGPIDEWVEGHGRGTHDEGGRFAAGGHVHEGLLAQLCEHPWFGEEPPKSLDRYDFNANMARGLSFEDGAATLTAFSARAVAMGLALLPERPSTLVVCGGGRHNPAMMARLREEVPARVISAEDAGWRGDSIEAEAFAFLAVRTLRGLPISWPKTTGAPAPMTGGRLIGA